MLTGSYASSLHSIPRATRDIDIVIFPNRDQLTRFVQSLPANSYHSDLDDALDSLRRRSQFNVIDYETGWKVDFIIPPLDEFHEEEFARRRLIEIERWVRKLEIEQQWRSAQARAAEHASDPNRQ